MPLFTADLETTTDINDCRVWAWGCSEIGDSDIRTDFIYDNNIESFITFMKNSKNSTFYFHNLKFDGEFLLNYLFENGYTFCINKKELDTKQFSTLISDSGQWYSIEICFERKNKRVNKVKIYDSHKILPFPIKQIAKGFNLPFQKGEIDYHEFREVGHKLTAEEIDYLKRDVKIPALALQTLFEQNLEQMTQGSNAFHDFKNIFGKKRFERDFPIPMYDSDLRQSYKGGFTYCNPIFQGKDLGEGIVLDVNSLYPSVMYYDILPYGEPIFFNGKYKPDKLYNLYICYVRCNFELKENHIPTLQIKNNLSFMPTQYLTSSNNEEVTLCMTNVDLEMFKEHYEVFNLEYLCGWKFKGITGLFKEYIDKWVGIKIQSEKEGNMAMRTLAKLMLNALYGKFALNPNVQSKIPYYEDDMVKFKLGEKETRNPIYVPMASFITAYARKKTISSAQTVYERFVYADTDSLHLLGKEIPANLEIDKYKLGAWKHESTFERSRFLRQKSYIEEENVTEKEMEKLLEDGQFKSNFYYVDGELRYLKITCAGMPNQCYENVTWDNFVKDSKFAGKLAMKHTKGGIVLVDTPFTLKL